MTIKDLLTEETYILNTPNYIIKRFDNLIKNTKLKSNQRKVLQEIKGILVGKYPSEQSLKNSIKGIKNKTGMLEEAVLTKLDKLLVSALMSISLISTSLAVGSSYKDSNSNLGKAIERKMINSKGSINSSLIVEVDEAVWKDIEVILSKLENELNKEGNIDKSFETVKNDLSKHNIDLYKNEKSPIVGKFNYETNRIGINIDSFARLADNLSRDNDFIKNYSKRIRDTASGTLKHELTHKSQFEKMNFIVKAMVKARYSISSIKYEKQMIEIGAYHAELLDKLKSNSDTEFIKAIDNVSPQLLRNITEMYPSNDSVVKRISSIGNKYKTLNSTMNLSSKQTESIREYIQILHTNKNTIELARAELK